MPCHKLRQMPTSNGNSWRFIIIWIPFGPVSVPPLRRAFLSRTSCLSIIQASIVVVLVAKLPTADMSRMDTAKSVTEFTARSTNKWDNFQIEGPRYYGRRKHSCTLSVLRPTRRLTLGYFRLSQRTASLVKSAYSSQIIDVTA